MWRTSILFLILSLLPSTAWAASCNHAKTIPVTSNEVFEGIGCTSQEATKDAFQKATNKLCTETHAPACNSLHCVKNGLVCRAKAEPEFEKKDCTPEPNPDRHPDCGNKDDGKTPKRFVSCKLSSNRPDPDVDAKWTCGCECQTPLTPDGWETELKGSAQ